MKRSDCKPHQPESYWKSVAFTGPKHTGYIQSIHEFQGISPGGGPLSVDAPMFYPMKYSQV